jgi:hypothetical protein
MERRIIEGQTYQPFGASESIYQPFGASKSTKPFKADVKKETSYTITKDQLKELIKNQIEVPVGASLSIVFECCGGDDGYGGYSPMDLYSVKVTVTERSNG